MHALAKKSRTEEQRLQDYEAQAILSAALSRQWEQEALQEAQREQQEKEALRASNQRAKEFSGDANLMALDQGLERLFAKSGISNLYSSQEEPRPWNGKDPIWNVSTVWYSGVRS